MKNNEFVTRWVIDTVKEKYADDIALVISHTTLRIDDNEQTISYFVPITNRGNELARTFILNGEGFDVWGIPWERLEQFAELEEYNITVLADSEILYAKDDEWAQRFEMLKSKQRSNLADESKMRKCALKAYAQAKELYTEMLFAKRSDIRMLAGYVLDYLARAIAFSNHIYFKRSQTAQLEELQQLAPKGKVPEGFHELYLSTIIQAAIDAAPNSGFHELYLGVIKENDETKQKEKCHEAIQIVREYLEETYPDNTSKEHNYQDLADWYAELSYTWLRLRHYAADGDFIKVYMWGILLQSELNSVCEDFCLEKPELMECYDYRNLNAFINRADELEKWIRNAITAGGGVIHEYNSKEDFLNENP